jgi:tetratricopeptide (TPR) repeat protein
VFFRPRVATALFFLVFLISCSKRAQPVAPRLAVLPFDNLTSDTGLDWMSRALSLALTADLTPVKDLSVSQADSVEQAYRLKASRLVHGYFSTRNNALELRADIEDAATHKTIHALVTRGVVGNIVPLVNQIAKQISPAAEPFSTNSAAAFQNLGAALIAPDAASQDRGFEAATQADPNFSAAYVIWAEALLRRGDRAGVARIVASAMADHPGTIDQAKLAYLDASAQSDAGAQVQALRKWSRLTPADPSVARQLAEIESARREFGEAAQDYQRAVNLNQDDPALWNMLGYAQAYAGDLEAARRALLQYQKQSPPQDGNPLDSLGEVSFYLGDFAAAEKYFEAAHARNPQQFGGVELLKAAQARLMTGDLAGADTVIRRFIEFRKPIPGSFSEYQQAQWDFLTGRRKRAMEALQAAVPHLDANSAAIALCQLSVWKLETGDQKTAVEYAQQASERATSPAVRTQSAICRFLASGESKSTGSGTVDALALLFRRRFDEALPKLEAVYRETSPNSDGQIRTLLAWANVEAGRMQEARALSRLYPLPLASGDVLFACLGFPRFFYLKGAILENEGKREEARKYFQLYLRFVGDVPGIFGDREKAKKIAVRPDQGCARPRLVSR